MTFGELADKFDVQMAIFMLYWVAGIATHWGVKLQQVGISAAEYWTTKPWNSVASVLVSLAVVLNSLMAGDNEFMTYFGAGFVAEAMINRYTASVQADQGAQNARQS